MRDGSLVGPAPVDLGRQGTLLLLAAPTRIVLRLLPANQPVRADCSYRWRIVSDSSADAFAHFVAQVDDLAAATSGVFCSVDGDIRGVEELLRIDAVMTGKRDADAGGHINLDAGHDTRF